MSEDTGPSPRIYVASLSDYNAGRLHGVWIDAADDLDEIWSQINAMLAASPEPGAEEFAIHDHDGFYLVNVHEYESIENVHLLAEGIARHGNAFAVWAWFNPSKDWPEQLPRFEERFIGDFKDYGEFGEWFLEEMVGIRLEDIPIPDILSEYVLFGVDPFGRDMAAGLLSQRVDDRIYLFFNE